MPRPLSGDDRIAPKGICFFALGEQVGLCEHRDLDPQIGVFLVVLNPTPKRSRNNRHPNGWSIELGQTRSQ